ncbi:MAG: uL15 family ribosomal protein [Candidatus ainarchaeum sp.]|nr:uL15 family ribosomal protein [Candidatus ainarchaeum sp.]
MAVRHRKRSRHKYPGTRKWGRGNIKHGRGKGSRGGKGFAGSSKHKWIQIITKYPGHFGRESMRSLKPKRKALNLWEINRMALAGKFGAPEGGRYKAELAGYKVLGCGDIGVAAVVTADAFSGRAAEKIAKAGGEAKAAPQ